MPWHETSYERLELPESSWWIPRISILLGLLGVLVALV
jgi:hypothetical protein